MRRCFNSFSRSVVMKRFFTMSSKLCYENAIHKLNALQSNKATIAQIRKDIQTGQKCRNLEDMENFLLRTGVTLEKLDELPVVHIAGTKGKGSTSAMCESILRQHGYKTGFYSSPHLVAVRERIRLNGQVISEDAFAKYFHRVYDMLDSTKAAEGDMPKYFAFLTVLAYNVFLKEKVDVAIIEVGIGGLVDYTNILRKVPVVGITALGLDHTTILGNTIEQIAAAKAGIMKPGCVAYTVEQQPEAMNVLRNYAEEVQCPLYIAPKLNTLKPQNGYKIDLPVDLEAYKLNASLAVQLAHAWIRYHEKSYEKNIQNLYKAKVTPNSTYVRPQIETKDTVDLVNELEGKTLSGLKTCRWPGRYHELETDYAKFYLDGAHTKESMEICATWFSGKVRSHNKSILVFSATGDRDAENLLTPLRNLRFEQAFFVNPIAYKEINQNNDNFSMLERREIVERCQRNAETWKHVCNNNEDTKVMVLECVADVLSEIKKQWTSSSVLITGSLHLVGASLSILDPNLK